MSDVRARPLMRLARQYNLDHIQFRMAMILYIVNGYESARQFVEQVNRKGRQDD